jgi:hypothetical protein
LQLERSKIKCSPNFKVEFTHTSGVKKIKNPSEGTNFSLQADPQDVCPE